MAQTAEKLASVLAFRAKRDEYALRSAALAKSGDRRRVQG
jgi:hypothetical protein